jgi:hypothetical protein
VVILEPDSHCLQLNVHGCQSGDFQFVTKLSGLPEIVLHLLIHPAFGCRFKSNRKSHGHFGTNSRLAFEETCKSVSADTQCFRGFGNAQPQWFKAEFSQHFAGMRGIVHTPIG